MVTARERSTTVQRRSTLQTINSHCKRHKKSILPATTAPHIQLNLTVKYSMRPTTAIAAAMSPSGSGCTAGAAAGRPAASDEAFCAARRRASLDNSRSSTSAATTPRGGSAALALLPRRFMASTREHDERDPHTHITQRKKGGVCVCGNSSTREPTASTATSNISQRHRHDTTPSHVRLAARWASCRSGGQARRRRRPHRHWHHRRNQRRPRPRTTASPRQIVPLLQRCHRLLQSRCRSGSSQRAACSRGGSCCSSRCTR